MTERRKSSVYMHIVGELQAKEDFHKLQSGDAIIRVFIRVADFSRVSGADREFEVSLRAVAHQKNAVLLNDAPIGSRVAISGRWKLHPRDFGELEVAADLVKILNTQEVKHGN